MRGLLHRAAPFALLATLLASPARAQTTTTPPPSNAQNTALAFSPNLIVKRDTSTLDNEAIVYAKVSDCNRDRPAEFTFTVEAQNYSAMNVPVVEAWLGVDGEDCAPLANRVRPTGTVDGVPLCTRLQGTDGPQTNTREPIFKIPATELFDTPESDGTGGCDLVAGSPRYTIFLIPLQQPTGTTQGSEPLQSPAILKATFTLYTKAPEAPRNPRAKPGETEIGVTYERINNDFLLTRYRAYFDTAGCGDLSSLKAGEAPPPNPGENIIVTKTTASDTIETSALSGVELGAELAAAVVTIDPAGNPSNFSDVVCVQRIETDGFLDLCNNDPKCKGQFDSCSLSPNRTGGAFGAGLLMLVVGALIRRRRSR